MKLIYVNDNGETFEFENAYDLSGFTAGDIQILTSGGYKQNGGTYNGSLVSSRVYSFSFDLINGTAAEDDAVRHAMGQILSPFTGGKLYIETESGLYFTEVHIADGPTALDFGQSVVSSFDISFWSPSHTLKYAAEYSVKLSGFQGGLHLPYTLPYRLGTQANIVEIQYTSAIAAPILFEFRGPAVKPTLIKKETGETVIVNESILAGETLWIDTTPQGVDIYMYDSSGNKVYADQKTDPSSSFFQMTRGINTLEFLSGSSDQTSNEVYAHFYKRVIGV